MSIRTNLQPVEFNIFVSNSTESYMLNINKKKNNYGWKQAREKILRNIFSK